MLLRIQMQDNPAGGGGGGYYMQVAGIIVKGQWSREQRERSSTWRELMATYLVPAAYIKHLRERTTKHHTDNQNTEQILVIGSMKQHLHQLATNIYKICKDNSIILIPEWIPTEANWLSDINHDDYTLNTNIFAAFDILWGPHTVDRFASFRSRQIPRFNSKRISPATEGIDAFTISWKNENNWLFPPPAFIPKVLRHMEGGGEDGTLIVPMRKSAPWWPLLSADGLHPY